MATNDDNVIIMPETTGDTSSSVAFDGSGSTFHQREAFYREDFGAFYRRFLEIDEMERRCCASDKVLAFMEDCNRLSFGPDLPKLNLAIRQISRWLYSNKMVAQTCIPNAAQVPLLEVSPQDTSPDEETNEPAPTFSGQKLKNVYQNMEPLFAETNVLVSVNAAYSMALHGNFQQALEVIEGLREKFPPEMHSTISLHWQLAEACFHCDNALLNGDLSHRFATGFMQESPLQRLSFHSPIEANFRHAVLLGSKGEFTSAFKIVEGSYSALKRTNQDTILLLRTGMLLGQLYSEAGLGEKGERQLLSSLALARSLELTYFTAIIQRRIAKVRLGIGRKKRSQQKNGIFATLCRSDSLLERCKLKVPSRPQMDAIAVSGEEFSNVLTPDQLLIECAAQLDLNDETPALERLLYHWTQFHRTAELLLNYNCKEQITLEISSPLQTVVMHFDTALRIAKNRYIHLEKLLYKEGIMFWAAFAKIASSQRADGDSSDHRPNVSNSNADEIETETMALEFRNRCLTAFAERSKEVPGYVNPWLL